MTLGRRASHVPSLGLRFSVFPCRGCRLGLQTALSSDPAQAEAALVFNIGLPWKILFEERMLSPGVGWGWLVDTHRASMPTSGHSSFAKAFLVAVLLAMRG